MWEFSEQEPIEISNREITGQQSRLDAVQFSRETFQY